MTDGAKGEPRNPASVYAAAIEGTQASAYRLSGDSSWPRPASPLAADEGLVSVPQRTQRVEGRPSRVGRDWTPRSWVLLNLGKTPRGKAKSDTEAT